MADVTIIRIEDGKPTTVTFEVDGTNRTEECDGFLGAAIFGTDPMHIQPIIDCDDYIRSLRVLASLTSSLHDRSVGKPAVSEFMKMLRRDAPGKHMSIDGERFVFAWKVDPHIGSPNWVRGMSKVDDGEDDARYVIDTVIGPMVVTKGDFLVLNHDGRIGVIEQELFHSLYKPFQ